MSERGVIIEGGPGGDDAPPEYINNVVAEIERATGQEIRAACRQCPLSHWEISYDDPPALSEPLRAPGLGKARWLAECFCRVRHQQTVKLEPDPERAGQLRRAANTRLVFRCSDQAQAIADWQQRRG